MSHVPHARAAHIRHANRAGGFGGLGDIFTFTGFGFPGTSTTATPSSTSSASSLIIPSVPSVASSTASSTTTTTSSSALPSSSSIPTSSSTATTTSVPVTTTYSGTALNGNLTKVITHVVSGTASSTPSPSTSGLPAPSNALVAPVIGGVAGGILALAGLVFLVTFFLRRRHSAEQDAINFDPGAFRRSAMLITDMPTHQDTVARGFNPPPPAMMERRQVYPANSTYSPSHDGPYPASGNPLVFQAPFSPISYPSAASPVYNNNWPAPVLTRNPSAASSASSGHEHAQYAQDLERTSVTPFQAAQPVEISRHTETPEEMDAPVVNEFVEAEVPSKDAELPPSPLKDPFADAKADADEPLPMVQDLSFPSPPSPVLTTSSRYRVESMPPTLPEIVVHPRVSVNSAYLSDSGSSPSVTGFPSGQTLVIKGSADGTSPVGNRFPVTPSPLASSFSVPSPPADQSAFPAVPPVAAQARPVTVYDPEDAYGGI